MTKPQIIIDADKKETGSRFMGFPERWLDDATWRCENGHVSKMFLKSEVKGDVCLACQKPIWLTFPEDKELTSEQGELTIFTKARGI